MYYCLLLEGSLYFVNYSVLRRFGILGKKHELKHDKGIEGAIEKQIEKIENIAPPVKRLIKSKDLVEALKFSLVTFSLKSMPQNMAYDSLVNQLSKVSNSTAQFVDSAIALKILMTVLGMSLVDLLLGHRMSLNKTLKRALSIYAIDFERKMLKLPCPCNGVGC